jgi:hypothetical protein
MKTTPKGQWEKVARRKRLGNPNPLSTQKSWKVVGCGETERNGEKTRDPSKADLRSPLHPAIQCVLHSFPSG